MRFFKDKCVHQRMKYLFFHMLLFCVLFCVKLIRLSYNIPSCLVDQLSSFCLTNRPIKLCKLPRLICFAASVSMATVWVFTPWWDNLTRLRCWTGGRRDRNAPTRSPPGDRPNSVTFSLVLVFSACKFPDTIKKLLPFCIWWKRSSCKAEETNV